MTNRSFATFWMCVLLLNFCNFGNGRRHRINPQAAEPVHGCKFENQYIRDTKNVCMFYQCENSDNGDGLHPAIHACAKGSSLRSDYDDPGPRPAGYNKEDLNPCTSGYIPSWPNCIVGEWGTWGAWGSCSVTCGEGREVRSRGCSEVYCEGQSHDTRHCDKGSCAEWTTWSSWRGCEMSGDKCMNTRERSCEGLGSCKGDGLQLKSCNLTSCARYGPWQAWGSCSQSCGGGLRHRSRDCIGLGSCASQGPPTESESCNTNQCPEWSSWGPWGSCSVTCDTGVQTRSRSCLHGGVAGIDCPGSATDTQNCYEKDCFIYTDWYNMDHPFKSGVSGPGSAEYPEGDGDFEVDHNQEQRCAGRPVRGMECRDAHSKLPWDQVGLPADNRDIFPIYCQYIPLGLICVNEKAKEVTGKPCPDFEVRLKCLNV